MAQPSLLRVVEFLPRALGYSALLGLGWFFYRLYQNRMLVRRAQKQHELPMLPHSLIFGHLWEVAKLMMKGKAPSDLHSHWAFNMILKEHPELSKHGVIYLDTWPVSPPLIAVFEPGMISSFTQTQSFPKFPRQAEVEFKPFTDGKDMLNLEGDEWKERRAAFNPGFSARNIVAQLPWFVEEVLVFRDRLRKAAASGETIKLEQLTTDMALDVMTRATFGVRLQSQSGHAEAPWLEPFRKQAKLLYFGTDLFKQWNPLVPVKHWIYNSAIYKALVPYIEDAARNFDRAEGPQTVVNLALKFHGKKSQGSVGTEMLSDDVVIDMVRNFKIFLFAGHDTTAHLLAAVIYLLGCHPDKAAKVREEHDAVLGPDPTKAAEVISNDPNLLNQLPYTLAAVKEALRLYVPVGGTIRSSPKGWLLKHPDTGAEFPSHGFVLHASETTMMRLDEYFPSPDEYIPERFMAHDESDPLYIKKNTYRPFEIGPRACIGQELVMTETKLALALTAREFDVVEDYPEKTQGWFGHKAYQVTTDENAVTAKFKDLLPVKVKART